MREVTKNRKSRETDITISLNIDGEGKTKINSGIGFLDHMLELFAFWGHFDLEVITKEADLKVDIHHTNEDLGIVLGQAFKEALSDKKGINRIGDASVPMEEVTAAVSLDISGRGSFKLTANVAKEAASEQSLNVDFKKLLDETIKVSKTFNAHENYKLEYAQHFFESFAKQLGMNLNIKIENPSSDLHTTLEPVFKALGKALSEAVGIDPRRKGIPSTKGVID
ncbi:MAG: imidazoleglycerol-phosphate dehydratase [Candidatus Omnitrophica bacterium CG08_land_8_20_14_0_20_41_16]|uniref:Imidazoleglycerol-phosphate dehydratase n=1 Tax=Candidatus Sherwoodlollariibacterium unditelluris TaxID=1974757 RepID=A0A2G9YJZ5_9BACT|nr:MAG: imidazoleglycerol-phosphate dehydratase [Candidatus Omnitrophica bacterium CG23_combo_of_CG06-09_8_20_14_all_41_10]PIS33656.1 MAG: imidazoleglycerol-phosphate dehydratase [Candidatus Omnitrophica bacterium CG08_land_8_20_14_0_20_41_16]